MPIPKHQRSKKRICLPYSLAQGPNVVNTAQTKALDASRSQTVDD
jgi:hypothetical protein